MDALHAMWRDDDGQDIVEYALLAALISIVAIAVIKGIGNSVNNVFSSVNSALSSTAP